MRPLTKIKGSRRRRVKLEMHSMARKAKEKAT
jgi:hypothetical protein